MHAGVVAGQASSAESGDARARRYLDMSPSPSRLPLAERPSRRLGYVLSASIVGLTLFAAGAPSALYERYSRLWGFSTVVLTLVFGIYAVGVLAVLLLGGRLSDDIGRRPVLIGALITLLGMMVLFMLAKSVVWLFVARAGQGVATGALLSASSAAMLDLHPERDSASVGFANGLASSIGIALGVFISTVLVQIAPVPLLAPYVPVFVLVIVALVGVIRMPEPVTERTGLRLRLERPSVPRDIRGQFLLASLTVISTWSVGGLLMSLGPELVVKLFHTTNDVVAGLPFVVLSAAAAAGQFVFQRARTWVMASGGALTLALGLLMIVASAALGVPALLILGTVAGGIGFGGAFMGGLRTLSAVIPAMHRAAVMAGFYIVAYLGLSVPAVLVGLTVKPLGVESAFEIFGGTATAIALLVTFEAWRTRPTERSVAGSSLAGVGVAGSEAA